MLFAIRQRKTQNINATQFTSPSHVKLVYNLPKGKINNLHFTHFWEIRLGNQRITKLLKFF